jgi:cellulose synthase/poly-beta-1,6-N-acetylglucosamine synthase-like glycosyltransferase
MKTGLRPWAGLLMGLTVLIALSLWMGTQGLGWLVAGYFVYEIGLNYGLLVATGQGLRARRWPESRTTLNQPGISVLIAAHNERAGILETVRSVLAQRGVEFEIIIASDGSNDGMNEKLAREYALTRSSTETLMWDSLEGWPLRLLTLHKAGKGAALNQAMALARYDVILTLDADTQLAPEALIAVARKFQDPTVIAAGGFLYIRKTAEEGPLAWYQYVEYVKSFMTRIGLAHAGLCLQVSGALGAFRTVWLRRVGGFSSGSLTEDYEIIYRLHEFCRRRGMPYQIAALPEVVGWTEAPASLRIWQRQRRRWFAGFLQTLWDYRHLVGNAQMGRIGLIMLPIKCLDAVLPLWAVVSWGVLAGLGSWGEGKNLWSSVVLIFLAKWMVDLVIAGTLWKWHERYLPFQGERLSVRRSICCLLTEGWTYQWLRQWAVLPSYLWCWHRRHRQQQPDWKPTRAEV